MPKKKTAKAPETESLLIELLTEELPPKALRTLSEAFAVGIADGLQQRGLRTPDDKIVPFATPRRLAVYISGVLNKGVDKPVEQKLMPLSVARGADGRASEALRKKLAGIGRAHLAEGFPQATDGPDSLYVKSDGKAEGVYLSTLQPGWTLASALQRTLQDAVEELPVPKLMSYQLADGTTTEHFVRPAHGLVALHGDEVVDLSVLGLKAKRVTHGHRFQGAKDISLKNADEYEARLANEGGVIADFSERKLEIWRQLDDEAKTLSANLGQSADYDPLLDEVTALVEMPTVYVGTFEPEFLAIPQECLILTMRQNQKYFPLFDAKNKLTNRFLIVSNVRLKDPKNMVQGNERVIRSRLADARFFFDTDRKEKLVERVPKLGTIVYHNRLGTQLDRVERLRRLACEIQAKILPATQAFVLLADRAALLAKADSVTGMVSEFPELQGVMGRYYALADGEDPLVADAVAEHYKPRFAGDDLPACDPAIALALADKLDTLVGIWGIGQQSTGEKDPFGLRRAALGVLRILSERGTALALDLGELLREAAAGFAAGRLAASTVSEVHVFMLDRLRSMLRERNFEANEIEAVLADNPTHIARVWERIKAVRAFQQMPAAASLAAANKRARNILRKEEFADVRLAKSELLIEDAEKALAMAIVDIRGKVNAHYDRNEFVDCLKTLANLRTPVDAFFDQVLVNAEDAKVRANRLALLSELSYLLNKVADISKLAA